MAFSFTFGGTCGRNVNRRVFQQKSLQPRQVALLCKDEIHQFRLAKGSPVEEVKVDSGFKLLVLECCFSFTVV